MEFTISLDSPFSLEHTLKSGQLFRWRKRGEWWYGVVSGSVLKIQQDGDTLRCITGSDRLDSRFVTNYFRLDENLEHVLGTLTKDEVITRAIEKYYGLRLVRQETWECLGSFVLATNANIPRIEKMVAAICARYGTRFGFEGDSYSSFPVPRALAGAAMADLRACGLGYRAPFLKRVAASVADGKIDFDGLASLPFDDSRNMLLKELLGEKVLLGVGPKVADCVLLYSCGKDEAFPMDVWIARVLAKSYPRLIAPPLRARLARDGKIKLSYGDYLRLSESVRKHFGQYAGYAQQYLYMDARERET